MDEDGKRDEHEQEVELSESEQFDRVGKVPMSELVSYAGSALVACQSAVNSPRTASTSAAVLLSMSVS